MKKAFLYMLMLAAAPVWMASCSSDSDDGPKPDQTFTTPTYKASAVKLNLNDDIFDQTGIYKSIEFTESGTFIVKKQHVVVDTQAKGFRHTTADIEDTYSYITGTYTVSGKTYTLAGFGTLTITAESGSAVTFTVKLNNADVVTAQATKVAAVASDTKTDNLCRSWNIVRTEFRYIELDANGKEKPAVGAQFTGANLNEMGEWLLKNHDVNIMDELAKKERVNRVVFSKAGTYALIFPREESIGTWKWISSSAGTLTYTWDEKSMENNFENGTASVSFDGSYCVLLLAGDVDTASSGTRYRVTMQFAMQEAK